MSQDKEEYEACIKFVEWMHERVTDTGRGDSAEVLQVEPRGLFWLGRLCSEDAVLNHDLGSRGERLDPCAIELRLRPHSPAGPWRFSVIVRAKTWSRRGTEWRKDEGINVQVPIQFDGTGGGPHEYGSEEITHALIASGALGRSAAVRVELEDWHETPELLISLVNTSAPRSRSQPDTHLYETSMEVVGIDTVPFVLTDLPDSFRYDRTVPAIGRNCGVEVTQDGVRTTDTVTVDKHRPEYWDDRYDKPDLTFDALASDPVPELEKLHSAGVEWGKHNWSEAELARRARSESWSEATRLHAQEAARAWESELERFAAGIALLKSDGKLLQAFRLSHEAIRHASRGNYKDWRAFQIGFLVSSLNSLVDSKEAETVDTVWFATGGGKTETYLGLLVTAVIYDRLLGKHAGISAWSRFPLKMLSLQQTQRFADALAGAELARQKAKIPGEQISLGFFVGRNATPNEIGLEPSDRNKDDAADPAMPAPYQVLLRCPFCHREDLKMEFVRKRWSLQHVCPHDDCPKPPDGIPFYIVDLEIYRFLPSVVVGTLDKAAMLGMQALMRGFVGPPHGVCSKEGHGFIYSPRKKNDGHGCLVPKCRYPREELRQSSELWAPRLRLQDELHLLRDSLGAVDSHYEALLDHLQGELGATKAKVIASSATLSGVEHQVDVLYQRKTRVFPEPGPRASSSFWSQESDRVGRRYVAVAPRGQTLEFVSDRTLHTLQSCVRRLVERPDEVCAEIGIDRRHADFLISVYGVDVVYGNTIRDVNGARRSVDTQQLGFDVNAETLTGGTSFSTVRKTLQRLEKPELAFEDRLHIIAASSMMSHGVDVDRLNCMVMWGLPLSTAEFIQSSARIGRRYPGLVYVLHRIAREREAVTFSKFDQFIRQGDRFVEPIPVTRRSRRVLAITTPGLAAARLLAIHQPAAGIPLTTVKVLRNFYEERGIDADTELEKLRVALGYEGGLDELAEKDLEGWLRQYFENMTDGTSNAFFPSELSPSGPPMMSLRDVEETAVVSEDIR